MLRSKFQREIRRNSTHTRGITKYLQLRKGRRVYDLRPHVAVLAFLLAFFGIYQLAHISASGKGLEASAIGGALSNDAREEAGTSTDKADTSPLFTASTTSRADDPLLSSSPALLPARSTTSSPKVPVTFSNVRLIGKAAVVIDTTTGKVLYHKNANTQLPLASITKVVSALVAKDLFTPSDSITMDKHALEREGNYGFELGAEWNFEDLLNYTLVVSSNDGITAIADKADAAKGQNGFFVKKMNEKSATLGLSQMFFLNPSGLDLSTSTSGGYGSAYDVAALFQYVYMNYPNLLDATAQPFIQVRNEDGRVIQGENTDELVGHMHGIIASKTGYTDLAGGNLAITWNTGLAHPVTAVVLGSTEEGRFHDMEELMEATMNSFAKNASIP